MLQVFSWIFAFEGKVAEGDHIHELCEHEHCDCQKSILKSALLHTVKIAVFLILIAFALNLVLEIGGEEVLTSFLSGRKVLGPVLTGLVGLIPNCGSSVVITELYLGGALGFGSMLAGLLVNAGVGLLVLFRVNKEKKENLTILGILYVIGVLAGVTASLIAG